MKRYILLLLACCAMNVPAATYYVATDGNNSAKGTKNEPWRDILHASQQVLPGDTILIRGGIYRGCIALDKNKGSLSGEDGKPITFQNVEGDTPQILGSESFSKDTDWTSNGGIIWRTARDSVTGYDVGCIWLDDKATEKKWALAEVKEPGDFYFDPEQQCVFLCSKENPVRTAKNIEIPVSKQWENLISVRGVSYIVLEGLTLKYPNTHGVQFSGAHHITIRNCTISHGGGAWIWKDGTRYGNAVELYGGGHDLLVEKCTISAFFDTGITNQGEDGDQFNIVYRDNHISNVKCALEHWATGSMNVRHVLYENNHITDTGSNWARNLQNVWGAVRLMRMHPNGGEHSKPATGVIENFVVRGNIIERCGSQKGGHRKIELFREHPSIRVIGGPYIIENNTITDGLSEGIYVSDGFSGKVTGNTVRNCAWSGLVAENISPVAEVRDNVIQNNGDKTHPNVVIAGSK